MSRHRSPQGRRAHLGPPLSAPPAAAGVGDVPSTSESASSIAEVGNRGRSTGPHLHIGVMVDGSYVNPRPWPDEHGIGY